MPNESLVSLAILAGVAVSFTIAAVLNETRKAACRRQKFRRAFAAPDFGGPDLAARAERNARRAGITLPLL